MYVYSTASVTVRFAYTEKYPDEVPVVEITESDNLEDDQLNELLDLLHTQVGNAIQDDT